MTRRSVPAASEDAHQGSFRLGGILTNSRLQLYGYAIAAIYAAFLLSVFRAGTWITDPKGMPIYTDFACAWMAAVQAVHGQTALLYDPVKFVEMQAAVAGPSADLYPNWPYPPTFLLIMAPFAALRYPYAFMVWDLATLVGCIAVVYAITGRSAAIALVLACPFTAWNFLAAQNGLLTTSLIGAALLFLERRPTLAGIFIGGLTYKPQFGLLIPVALLAAKQWRAIVSAGVTAVMLAGASVVAFGTHVWAEFPRELVAQTGLNLFAGPDGNWGYLQSLYGLIRTFHGGAAPAWVAQGTATFGGAVIVCLVWRSPIRFSLKAATLSVAALTATPYAFAYDMAAIVIPAAFLVRDQLSDGFLAGERAIAFALFGSAVAALIAFGDRPGGVTFGSIPAGPLVVFTLLGVILHRILCHGEPPVLQNEHNQPQSEISL